MDPIFEYGAMPPLQLVEHALSVIGYARLERMVVGSIDDRDGVDLNVTQLLDRPGNGVSTATERVGAEQSLTMQEEPSCLPRCDIHAVMLAGSTPRARRQAPRETC